MDTNINLERDKNIITRWLSKDKPYLRELAEEFNLSIERIRQILKENNISPREKPAILSKKEKQQAKLASRILSFWNMVDVKSNNECWEWIGYKHPKLNYGLFSFRAIKETFTHRIAWRLSNNLKTTNKLHVLHKCDNPPCCNPNHLFLGTKSENAIDRTKKGRTNGAKFSAKDIIKIRNLYDSNSITIAKLAKIYNSHYSTMYNIVHKNSWKWIE